MIWFLTISYLILYTGFNKQTKTLDCSMLFDICTFKSISKTISEANKLISLVAITAYQLTIIKKDIVNL